MNLDAKLLAIRSLLIKAEHNSTKSAEAATLRTKAADLMSEYDVRQALIDNDALQRFEVGDRVLQISAPYLPEKTALIVRIAAAVKCRAVLLTPTSKPDQLIRLYGFNADLAKFDILFTYLMVQTQLGMWTATPTKGRWLYDPFLRCDVFEEDNRGQYRKSWLTGFVMTIGKRLDAIEAKTVRSTFPNGDKALVLVDRSAMVKTALAQMFPAKARGARKHIAGSGYEDGVKAGRRADLGGLTTSPPISAAEMAVA